MYFRKRNEVNGAKMIKNNNRNNHFDMNSFISFNLFKLISVGAYFLLSIILLYTNTNAGKILSYFEFHRPICGTLDLFSNRAKSKVYREFWQQVKVILLVGIFVYFVIFLGFDELTLIFAIYLVVFFNSGRFAVIVARGEDLSYKVKFLNSRYIVRYIKVATAHKRELSMLLVSCFSSVSYASFYLTFEGSRELLLLRCLDLLGFSFSFFYQKYLLRGLNIPRIAIVVYIATALLLAVSTFNLVNLELSLFFLMRLLSGYFSILFLYLKREFTISIISIIISMSFWSYHFYSEIFSLKIVLFVEVICLLGFVVNYVKIRRSL